MDAGSACVTGLQNSGTVADGAHSSAARGAQRHSGWRDLTPDLLARIASYAHPNDVAGCLKLLNREAYACLKTHTRLALAAPPLPWPRHDLPPAAQQPWPGDAFVRHWGRAEPWQAPNLRERRRLLCLAAGSGHAASLAAALAHCGCALDVHALEAAAAAGDVSACETLLSAGCEWGQSVFAAAAAAGQLPVCQAFWASGLRPLPIGNRICVVTQAACSGGHMHVLEWLEQVGFVRLLAPQPPAAAAVTASAAAAAQQPHAPMVPTAPIKAAMPPSGSSCTAAASGTFKVSNSRSSSRPTAPDASPVAHAFATTAAACHGHTALLHRLLDFGRGRYGVTGRPPARRRGPDGACGGDGSRRLLCGVAKEHRRRLLSAFASGGTAEEFAAAYDEYAAHEREDGSGAGLGLVERDSLSSLLLAICSSPRPDGSWTDKVDFLLARIREWLHGGADAGAAADEPVLASLAHRGQLLGAAHHSDPEEVERRVRFLVSRGLQPGPSALQAVAAAGSVGAAQFLLEQCGVVYERAVGDEAAICGRLGMLQWLWSRCLLVVDERLLECALDGLQQRNLLDAFDLHYGAVFDRHSSPPRCGTAGEAMQLLRWVTARLAGTVDACEGLGGGDGETGDGRAVPGPGPLPFRQHGGLWLRLLKEACVSGVSDIDLLEQLLERTGLLAPRPVAAAAAGAAVADEDEEEDVVDRAAIATRLANGMLAGGSEAAVHWAARRLRELRRGAAVPALTPGQLWKAALGGNLAAVRAACATGLAHMPDWLPECACEAAQPAGGHVAGAMRFFLEQPTCRGAKNWRRLWRRLRAEQAERFWVVHLTPAQMEWLRWRQKQQAEKRRQAASRVADRVLCGLGGALRRMCGRRGAGGGGDDEEEAGPEAAANRE
ncbi:hypothetical protein HYH02_012378 [Chlamydomonas schloesseri]|uniref:Uncharacterized protein n=1 Tax=Chlamydomonas schloesseri TaxID=2026947 RepID=A0A835SWF9_9CHLO|nr:hypothetical protein HYH02_012378 [Chlamydomonas schloesseri]|eukprot:KAG2434363.1 hypothetical protein HYH02_012378 [Chlamydomonas schloesseri]